MASMWNERDRAALTERLRHLDPRHPAAWGKMTCPQMVSHLIEALRMAFGELAPTPRHLPLRYPPLKQLVVYVLPIPRGVPTASELLSRVPADFPRDVAQLTALIGRFAAIPPDFRWPEHPAFGKLTRRAWGVLAWRHADHHLRQFGV